MDELSETPSADDRERNKRGFVMRRPMERIPSRRFLEDSSSNQFNGSSPPSSSMLAIPFPSQNPFSFLSLLPLSFLQLRTSIPDLGLLFGCWVDFVSCHEKHGPASHVQRTTDFTLSWRNLAGNETNAVPLEQIAFIYLVTERNDERPTWFDNRRRALS